MPELRPQTNEVTLHLFLAARPSVAYNVAPLVFAAFTMMASGCRGPIAPSGGSRAAASTATSATVAPAVTPPPAGAPCLLYTDLVAGPTSGGENNKGAYLSLFGTNFGTTGLGRDVKVFINDIEVDNYRYLGPSRGRRDIQQITVQLGAIGDPLPGAALPIKVVVNGVPSNTNHSFTVQQGDILFVSTTGNDSTAAKNDIARPWRTVQTPSEGGALGDAHPGDVVVLRGGPRVIWSDVGRNNRWIRFRHVTGNAPTGARGHGYVSIVSYPGEDVHYVAPPNTSGGIHGLDAEFPEFSDWIVISGLHIESAASSRRDGAPINLQTGSDHWRVVNNELGPWPADARAHDRAGGLTGNGKSVALLGNHIHDIGGGTENHGIYLDSGSTDIEVAYNSIHDVTAGNLLQTFDNLGNLPLSGISVHHNVLFAGRRYALNIATGTRSFTAWNNVIFEIAFAGVRFDVRSDPTSSYAILSNTIFDANTATGGTDASIVNNATLDGGMAVIKNNIVAADASSRATAYFADKGSGKAIKLERNLWFGLRRGTVPSADSDPVGGRADTNDPRFADAAHHDFRLSNGSPAIDQATANVPIKISDDYRTRARPSGARTDVGAFEF